MRMQKRIGLWAIIGTALLLQASGAMTEGASCRSDEYKVMSLLINEQYEEEFSLILISRDTEPWCLREQLTFLQRQWPKLKGETIDSLIVNNSGVTARLTESFSIPVKYRLVTDHEYLQALHGSAEQSKSKTLEAGAGSAATGVDAYASITEAADPDWDNFDTVFPDAQGYLTFSKVGFDSECTQALVIFSNAYRCSGARVRPNTRKIAHFSRKNGVWKLVGISRNLNTMY